MSAEHNVCTIRAGCQVINSAQLETSVAITIDRPCASSNNACALISGITIPSIAHSMHTDNRTDKFL